jgi:hypothetical protein
MKRLLVVVPILLLVMLGACSGPGSGLDPHTGTLVAQTQTASVWTPTPLVTAVPNQVLILDTLNSGMRGVDGLDEAIDAKFNVADIAFESYRNSSVTNLLRVQVECEWISKPSCTAERAFVVFVHAFAGKKIRPKIIKEIPVTITIIQIKALDHLAPIGTVEIDLADLSAYLDGHITCDQLVARMRRTNP